MEHRVQNSKEDETTAIMEVIRGQELLIQLRSLLLFNQRRGKITDHLLEEVLRSLGMALSHLKPTDSRKKNKEPSKEEETVRQAIIGNTKKQHEERISRVNDEYSMTIVTTSPLGDGYQWRKYGHKNIFKSKYPRSYFRCSYSGDLKCPVKKQVQQMEGDHDPPNFMVKYNNTHTCHVMLAATEFDACAQNEECMLSFESNDKDLKEGPKSSISVASTKQELFEESFNLQQNLREVESVKLEEQLFAFMADTDDFLQKDFPSSSSCDIAVEDFPISSFDFKFHDVERF